MSSKLKNRCTTGLTCVAILVLVAVIVTVWVMLGEGAFKHGRDRASELPPAKNVKQKEYIEKTHLDHFDSEIEFVKPKKISSYQDITFDQLHNNYDKPPLRHHSGHFRHKEAEIWDLNPSYEIEAFGHKLHLELTHNDNHLADNLHVTRVFENFSHRTRQGSKFYGCYYSGKIKDDLDSDVTVSLCNGMTGYIRTSQDNYYIEPAEKSSGDYPMASFLHRIKKIPHNSTSGDNDVITDEVDHCGTNANSDIVQDDSSSSSHTLTKRAASDDTPSSTLSRPPRQAEFTLDRKTNEYFVKVLIVADRSMMQYHQTSENLTHYVSILMSHAARLFKDASIGNSISLSVVDMWILNGTSFASSNSQKTLRNFCEWQKGYVSERRHDMALLFTRDPLCKRTNCGVLGVAEVGSMCNPSTSCAVVKDRGLSSSYTIAHEIGHVLSMLHDDENASCSAFPKSPKNNYIMYGALDSAHTWSECSRSFVTEFLESNKAKCLQKPPSSNYMSNEVMDLPGVNYDGDKQCEMENGAGNKICPFGQDNSLEPCAVLWCYNDTSDGCFANTGWADGSSCGDGKWCYQGHCIPSDKKKMTPVAGGWGAWQSWSDCSRTCDGGVKYTKRDCDSPRPKNGGGYCTGRSMRYASCNTQSCGTNVPDFRAVQCSEFDGQKIANMAPDVEWLPKYGTHRRDDLCKLFCRPKNSTREYVLKNKVVDGTKCDLNSFDICVNGICRPGGCDNKLNSKAELDDCGICDGDNSKCQAITGTYDIPRQGFNIVLHVPKGSSSLDIRQNANNDTNYLVLVDGESGEYILNSNVTIAPRQKDVIFGSVTISYSGSFAPVERITTPRNHKLPKSLILWLLSTGDVLPPNISYRYIVNDENAPKYGWRLHEYKWSKCSLICSGTQYRLPVCTELATSTEQPDSYCNEHDRLHRMQKRSCNEHCQLQWSAESYGPCSVNCGTGIRSVNHQCVKVNTTKEHYEYYKELVDDKHCNSLRKPPQYEDCQGLCESTRWEYSNWSQCSVSCGGGAQYRSAKCMDDNGDTIEELHCINSEKVTQQPCNTHRCPVWESREWTPCSVTCGRGFRTKPYFCHLDGRVLNPSACNPRDKHIEKEPCVERPCSGWWTGIWGPCTSNCGDGLSYRKVICRNLDDDLAIADTFCSGILKPNGTKYCNLGGCVRKFDENNEIWSNAIVGTEREGFRWITGPWSQCSKSCGTGFSSRMVVCRNRQREENDLFCSMELLPISRIECNTFECPHWEYGGWSECDLNCEKERQVTCLNATDNFVPDIQCFPKAKPPVQTPCKPSQCRTPYADSFEWSVSKWKPCSTSCGEGKKYRHLVCKNIELQSIVVDDYCKHLSRPRTNATCEKYNCDGFAWVTAPWSQCSAFCGEGVKNRSVTCHRVFHRGAVDPAVVEFDRKRTREYCDWHQRPEDRERCWGSQCERIYVWRSEPWKQCSHPCGKKGRSIRQIYCYSLKTHQKVEKRFCSKHGKPRRRTKCNQWRCLFRSCKEIQHRTGIRKNKDYVVTIRNKPATIYCYKMDTSQPEEYITLHGDMMNYAENYDKRLIDPHSCPYDGRRVETCECLPIGPERSGRTLFWKVRLNITSLRIIGDDFTFSRQVSGTRVPFGTAGDCYSAIDKCAQGRFSIYLNGTSFRLADHVRWQSIGKYATVRIVTDEKHVEGLCGGYCGNCVPEPGIGLQVEIT